MPSGPNIEIDYSKFTYGSKQTSADESDSKPSEYASCKSDSSVDTSTSMPEPVENASKVVCEPKVWTDAPIIEEYESYSDNDSVSNVQEDKEKPSFAFTDSVKHVKTSRENIKKTGTTNHSPKIEKHNRNGHTRKGLGYAFTRKACFVCGSFSHLIRDCDFHEKRMAKQAELTKSKNKVTGQRENRPVWNNVQKVDHQNKHMIGNKAHLANYQEFKGGSVAFGGSNERITGKGDWQNKVFFIDTDCLVMSLDFKLPDKNQVLLKIPRQHNMYSFNLKNIVPSRDLACLFAKTLIDESNKWHRRLGHVNFKNLNKLVKGNLVRGLPSKNFENNHTCVACQKEKQHKASCKAKKDETTPILKDFIRQVENQFNHKVKTIRSGIKREYNNARTSQQNGVDERKNRTLIEAARTMLADSFLPTTFWVEAVNTACYVLNRVLVTKPQNKTPYEILIVGNQANKSAGPKEANNSAWTQANDDQGDKIEKNTSFKTYEKPVSQVEQVFLEELEKLKRKEKEANDAAKSLRKEATHDIQNASTSSTNLINTASTPLSTTGPLRAFNDGELAYPDPSKYALPDDPSMPHLEDFYARPSEGIFTNSSYDNEGVGHRQEEGIDYDEVFALMARIEAKRIFFAFASYMGFIVYQMDVKSAFLTWYATLSTFLEKSRYRRGAIDKTLFIKKDKKDIMLVQVYVDDIIFGSTKKSWCDEFEELMKNRFQMSFIGELTFFLGLQVKQKEDGIFISQDKYVAKILKKFDFLSVKTDSTPIETQKPLVKDEEVYDVDVTPKTSYLHVVKRIFRYLKGQPKLGLWYPKVSSFDLEAYSDSDYAGVNLDRKFTTGGCQFLSRRLILWQCKKQTIVATSTTEVEYVAAARCCGQVLWIQN
nr:hypothetical protein [Tanacetum cinerariifolium]